MRKGTQKSESEYQRRLACHMDELRWLYMELYDDSVMFDELCGALPVFYRERSEALRNRDLQREAHPDWYRRNDIQYYHSGCIGQFFLVKCSCFLFFF